jgi:hypothetical protein
MNAEEPFDRDELRTWVIAEIDEAPVEETDDFARAMAIGRVDGLIALGRRFGLLTDEEVVDISARMP